MKLSVVDEVVRLKHNRKAIIRLRKDVDRGTSVRDLFTHVHHLDPEQANEVKEYMRELLCEAILQAAEKQIASIDIRLRSLGVEIDTVEPA